MNDEKPGSAPDFDEWFSKNRAERKGDSFYKAMRHAWQGCLTALQVAAPASPAASDDLRDSVLSALDDLKLVIDGTMGVVGLETTFVSLVEALEADRAVDSDWRCRRNNAFERFALLAASVGGESK